MESDGLVFDHRGTCVLKRGTWKTKLTTNLYPAEDISLLNEIHRNMSNALKSIEGIIQDYTLNQTVQAIGGFVPVGGSSFKKFTSNRFSLLHLKKNPLSRETLEQLMHNISAVLPNGYSVMDNELANDFQFTTIEESLVIIVETIVISKETHELFNVHAIPNAVIYSQIIVDHLSIVINHHKEYFYPEERVIAIMNTTHFLVNKAEIRSSHYQMQNNFTQLSILGDYSTIQGKQDAFLQE